MDTETGRHHAPLRGRVRFAAESVSNEPQLVCPVCGFEYVHFRAPRHLYGGDYENQWVRGDVLEIPFYCENGHTWSLELGAHKGYAFLRYSPEWGKLDELP